MGHPTVLIVDDDPAIRKMLVEVLSLEGYPTETANDGREALDILDHSGPRVVLLDLLMPGVSGRQVMEQLRATPGARAKHGIIFLSAVNKLEEHRDLEPDATLAKPFTVIQLLNVLDSVSASA
jgi:two-component system, OmpR family, phosphate regulon response regulator PhoB